MPAATTEDGPYPAEEERNWQVGKGWGEGDPKNAKKELLRQSEAATGKNQLPWASFPALTATGPSGERYEHLQDSMAAKEIGPRRRLRRALDRLLTMWAAGSLPQTARWLLGFPLMWLSKIER